MINRDRWGGIRVELSGVGILRFDKDELLRKHLPRMFSLIKNKSWKIEDDQVVSSC